MLYPSLLLTYGGRLSGHPSAVGRAQRSGTGFSRWYACMEPTKHCLWAIVDLELGNSCRRYEDRGAVGAETMLGCESPFARKR